MFSTCAGEVCLANKVVWVSGASSGLGRAAAQALVTAGWQVVAGARSFVSGGAQQDGIARLPLDVRSDPGVQAFVSQALALYGPPDALVNAAGILVMGPAEETSLPEYEAVLDTILLGSIRMTQAVLPLMRGKGGGKIAMLSSVNGLMPTPYQSAYVAAKHALEGYSECLMLETGGQGIQVMLVEPGDHSGGSDKYRAAVRTVSGVYEGSLARVRAVVQKDEAQGGKPEAFGRVLARALGKRRLPARLRVTALKEYAAIVLHDILPGRLFQRFLSGYYKV